MGKYVVGINVIYSIAFDMNEKPNPQLCWGE